MSWYINIRIHFRRVSQEVELLGPDVNTPEVFYSPRHSALKKDYHHSFWFLCKLFYWKMTSYQKAHTSSDSSFINFQKVNLWSICHQGKTREIGCRQHCGISLRPPSISTSPKVNSMLLTTWINFSRVNFMESRSVYSFVPGFFHLAVGHELCLRHCKLCLHHCTWQLFSFSLLCSFPRSEWFAVYPLCWWSTFGLFLGFGYCKWFPSDHSYTYPLQHICWSGIVGS